MREVTIRAAEAPDAEALSALSRLTFIETFVDEFRIPYPKADLDAYLEAAFAPQVLCDKVGDPSQAWWVALLDGEMVGFANAGPCGLPHPDARPSHAELRRLYIAKRAQSMGLGTRLLHQALRWMEAHTDGPLWVGVWSKNFKAQRLYGFYGFEKAGDYKYPVGTWFDDEFILRRTPPG